MQRCMSTSVGHLATVVAAQTRRRAATMTADARQVAVVGAGLAGLSAAVRLADLGISCVVFDMGTRAPGGRSCSRILDPSNLHFDHGCQFMAPQRPQFRAALQGWTEAGAVAEWGGRLGSLTSSHGAFTRREDLGVSSDVEPPPGFCGILKCQGPVYVGMPSMGALAAHLAGQVQQGGGQVLQGTKVSQLHWDDATSWTLQSGSRASSPSLPPPPSSPLSQHGPFAATILADALTAVSTSPGYAGLLECDPAVAALAGRMLEAAPVPVFTLMVAFSQPLSGMLPFDGASIEPPPPASGAMHKWQWLACNSSKPGRPQGEQGDGDCNSAEECWTAVTTPEYAADVLKRWPLLKGGAYNPQTAAYKEGVAGELLEELHALLRPLCAVAGSDVPPASYVHAQRWGRAFVGQPLQEAFLEVPQLRLAACGDFCGGGEEGRAAGGAELAWMSGRRAAEAVAAWL